eukprot:3452256-Alexandrium_andersonii.AAC.1
MSGKEDFLPRASGPNCACARLQHFGNAKSLQAFETRTARFQKRQSWLQTPPFKASSGGFSIILRVDSD